MTPCIEWTGNTTNSGYGQARINGQMVLTHRHAWEQANGHIPDDKEINHLCQNRRCRNVDHLECVTHKVNCNYSMPEHRKQGLCKNGHTFTGISFRTVRGEELYNGRVCQVCRSEANRRWKARCLISQ